MNMRVGARLNRNAPWPTLWSANNLIIPPTARRVSRYEVQTRRGVEVHYQRQEWQTWRSGRFGPDVRLRARSDYSRFG